MCAADAGFRNTEASDFDQSLSRRPLVTITASGFKGRSRATLSTADTTNRRSCGSDRIDHRSLRRIDPFTARARYRLITHNRPH